jgi:predicted MFS family arabinose efflux permease
VAEARRPRENVVVERLVAPDEYEAVDGPVSSYRRTLEVSEPDGDDNYTVRQSVEVQSAIPFWGWLFGPPLHRQLARIHGADKAPFWFPPDRLDEHASTALARLGLLAFVLGYCGTLITQTMTYVAAEFHTTHTGQGYSLAAVRFDVLIAMPLALLADRRGRRILVIGGTIAACALTTLGAIAPNLVWLTAAQILARGAANAAVVTLGVMVAEEMPAGARAWATSLMVMAGAFGAGMCVILLPVADIRIWTWRILYLVPLVGIPMARTAGRHLAESRRYVAAKVRTSMRGHGRRFWLLASSGFLLALFAAPASQFQNDFLKHDRGFTGAQISLFIVATSVPGAIGIVVGGRLAERGRRLVGAVAVLGGVGFTVAMFNAAGWPLWAFSGIGSLIGAAAVPALGVYGPELFPTGARGAANGILSAAARGGSVLGLVLTGYLVDRIGYGRAFSYLAVGPLILAILILAAYPETAHRELEELNPEDAPPPS